MKALKRLSCEILTAICFPKEPRDLRGLFYIYQFLQLIAAPTRITERSSTLIDVAFTRDVEKIGNSGVLQCSISDHSLIFLTRRAKKLWNPCTNIQYRNFKNFN